MRRLAMPLVFMSASPAWAADLLLYDGFTITARAIYSTRTRTKPATLTPVNIIPLHNLSTGVMLVRALRATNAPWSRHGSLSVAGLPASTGNSVTFDTTQRWGGSNRESRFSRRRAERCIGPASCA